MQRMLTLWVLLAIHRSILSGRLPNILKVCRVIRLAVSQIGLRIVDHGFDFSNIIRGSAIHWCRLSHFSLKILGVCDCENIQDFPIPDMVLKLSNDRFIIIEAKSGRVNKARGKFRRLKRQYSNCKRQDLDSISTYIIVLKEEPRSDPAYSVEDPIVRRGLVNYISSRLNVSPRDANRFIRFLERKFGRDNIYTRETGLEDERYKYLIISVPQGV